MPKNKPITKLKKNQILVFGSNLLGNHAGGAALQAKKSFEAEDGVGEGMTGQSYAFPTLGKGMKKRSIKSLEASRDALFKTCGEHPEKEFLLTKVGCGIAGYPEEDMERLFAYDTPKNLVLPDGWSRRLFKFLKEGMRSEKGDCVWEIGKEKKGKGKIKCCEAGGFHGSTRIVDALGYVKGEFCAEVSVRGRSDIDTNKQCWEYMTVLRAVPWSREMSVSLAVFSAEQVLDVFEKKYPKDKRPRRAIQAAKAVADAAVASKAAVYAAAAAAAVASKAAVYAAAAAADAAADAADASCATDAADAASCATDAADAASCATDAADAGTKKAIEQHARSLFYGAMEE